MAIRARAVLAIAALVGAVGGCRSPDAYRREADEAAAKVIQDKQITAMGRNEPFTIERPADTLRRRLLLDQHLAVSGPASMGREHLPPPKHWPGGIEAGVPVPGAAPGPAVASMALSLIDALQIGASNSREYQTQKEQVFITALGLHLEREQFRTTFLGILSGDIVANYAGDDTAGLIVSPQAGLDKRLTNGALFSARLGLDLARLLTGGGGSSLGIQGDASVTIPLLRGAGRHIVTEPLTQAERDVVYALWNFENYKRDFAVGVATQYLSVLQLGDQIANARENYRNLINSTRRAVRLAEAGRLDQVQVDQAVQQELSAREGWISAMISHERRLDQFKEQLGLPTDARVELDREELQRLGAMQELIAGGADPGQDPSLLPPGPSEAPRPQDSAADSEVTLPPPGAGSPGRLELPEEAALRLALDRRLDLRTAHGRVFDAQRKVIVAADALGAGLTLAGGASFGQRRSSIGSAALPDAELDFAEGAYNAGLNLDLPFNRRAERNAYRQSMISLERQVRAVQQLEDSIKLSVRASLGGLLRSRESLLTQSKALALAERRVASTTLFLEAGRVQIRDVLEAQRDLLSAQNALTAAMINYRVSELELQRNLGVLDVSQTGLWTEFTPEEPMQ